MTQTSKEPTSFRAKVLNSTKMSGIKFGSDVGLRLISTVVLTRLLAPEIYGVFAVVLVYMFLLEMFSDLGLRSLVLTKEGDVKDSFLRTIWTVSILRGIAIALFSITIACAIALMQSHGLFGPESAYNATELPLAIAALGGAALIMGLQSPMVFMEERQMRFGKVTLAYVATNIVALVVTVAMAFYLRSIWALVLGNVARAIVHVWLSFIFFKGPAMRLYWNRSELGLVVDRGKWIVGHSTLTALSKSADRLVLGFVMSSTTFGFYFIARQLVDLVMQFLVSVDAQMGLQVFRHLQDSTIEKFRHNYYRYRLFFDALAGLSAGGLLVLSPLIVGILFDDRYQGVAPIAQILIWAILLIGPTLLRGAFSAERRFKEMTQLSVVTAITLWFGLGLAVLVFDSVTVALVVIALHKIPEAMLITIKSGKRGWITVWREFLGFGFVIIGAALGLLILAFLGVFL